MTPKLIEQFKAARRVGVPLIAVTTPDPMATITAVRESLATKPVLVTWNVLSGLSAVDAKDDESKKAVANMIGELDRTIGNPAELLIAAMKLPAKGVLFMHLAHRWWGDPSVVQGVLNLRDVLKSRGAMLLMLARDAQLPPEISGDVIVFDEPLPDKTALRVIVGGLCADGGVALGEPTGERAVEALQGLAAFQAEQVTAMSLSKSGVDVPALWERKRQQIELTPGLKVHRDATTFKDIGGVKVVKDFLTRVMHGESRPNAVVFIDEIEKHLAGAGGGADSSGVSQDQLGTLLSYMQDHQAAGMIFVGPPGAAKSAVAKAAGNEAGIPTIQLDLGGTKGSLVGQSEQNLRQALKVVTSVSNGRSLWIATCNAISDLPPELRRRFTLGTFFFELPDEAERKAIWKIWMAKYGSVGTAMVPGGGRSLGTPSDEGWTGAEIRQCCEIAWRLGCTLVDAAEFVVPVSRSAAEQLDRLRRAADGRFLSASTPGVYRREDLDAPVTNGRRKFDLAEA